MREIAESLDISVEYKFYYISQVTFIKGSNMSIPTTEDTDYPLNGTLKTMDTAAHLFHQESCRSVLAAALI